MGIIEAIVGLLLLLWVLGLVVHIGGALIHALLVIAVIVLLMRFITGNRAA